MPSRPLARSILLVVSGICRESPGPGGWGFVACFPTGIEQEGSGAHIEETTVDRVEMAAAIEGFRFLGTTEDHTTPVRVVSSSQYLIEGATGKRERSGDADLWAALDAQIKNRTVAWEWEPPDTMFIQTQAFEIARSALRRALKGGGPQAGREINAGGPQARRDLNTGGPQEGP
jgi:ribonuclease HI